MVAFQLELKLLQIAAAIPGKCAAPPAPAIINLIPLSFALLQNRKVFVEFYEWKQFLIQI